MSNDESTPTSSSVWGKLDEKPSETPTHTSVTGAEKWDEVFGDVPRNQEWKFKPDELHPMTEKELKALEEANQCYGDVLAEMARKERN
jgi:hypothetical protein